uniref:Uncharacterized protein n=1 Tax=Oryza glumipatula TaxID=40148 RepID=A0A0D9ZTA1_9ORYZ
MSSGVAWVWMTEDAVASDELRRDRPRRAPGITDTGDELQRGARAAEDVAAATSRVAWVSMTEDAVAGDELRRGRPHEPPASRTPARTAEDVAAATSPAWGATAEDAADSDVVVGLLPAAPSPPPTIHGAAVNTHLQLHPRGRPVHPPPAQQLRREPSPVVAFVAGRRSRCESEPSSYPSAASREQRDKTGCKELVDLVMVGYGNRMIPDRYQDLIHRKHHPPCGKNRMIPDSYHPIPARYQDLIHRKHHPPRGKNRLIPDRHHLIPRKYHLIRGKNA